MLGLDHDHHAEWLETFEQRVCDIGSQSLLQLHFTEEYKLTPTREIRLDGGIWEKMIDEESKPPQRK